MVEPNAAGNGSVTASGNMVTRYTYDASDQLTQITQGSQIRKFKYDSLGRMTRQKLAEQTATINDAGTYVGSATSTAIWSDAFFYDTRSNLTKRTDARGVKTNFSYYRSGALDPLNRLQVISFDKTGADTSHGTINSVPNINHVYMTTGDKERLKTISVAGQDNNNFYYDTEGRLLQNDYYLVSRQSNYFRKVYYYDTANRLTDVWYPMQWGKSGDTRKRAQITYDSSSRLNDLKLDGVTQMDSIAYNDYGQATSIRIGGGKPNPLTEEYTFDANNGLLRGQKVKRGSTTLMNLYYGHGRTHSAIGAASAGTKNGVTGNLTHMIDYLDRNKDRFYEYDALGRLKNARGGAAAGGSGATANWTQNYTYDRYGNKKATTKSGITANSAAVPLDGLASQAYAATTNRITTSGHEYDFSGNMTRGKAPDGTLQRFEYDAAGRLVKIKTDAGALLEEYTYGASRERIKKTVANGDKTYYAWGGSSVIAEYTEAAAATTMSWAKSYVYAGSRLLSTITKNGAAETTEYHHPDRLGTKLVTNTALNTAKSQSSLPFGTAISSETTATTNQKFTSYDRSGATGLDYAVNRTYNSGQSRFTQVDPIGMASASIGNPQSLNLFAYTRNNPVDFVDPSGLFEVMLCSLYALIGDPGGDESVLGGVAVCRTYSYLKDDSTGSSGPSTSSQGRGGGGVNQRDDNDVDPPNDDDNDEDYNRQANKLINLVNNNVSFLNLNPLASDELRERLLDLIFSSDCTNAFRKARKKGSRFPRTIAETIRDSGIIYAPFSVLDSNAWNRELGISKATRKALQSNVTLWQDALTYTQKGNPAITFLRNDFFSDKIKLAYLKSETISHELIHAGGIGTRTNWLQAALGYHDLTNLRGYANIINSCKSEYIGTKKRTR